MSAKSKNTGEVIVVATATSGKTGTFHIIVKEFEITTNDIAEVQVSIDYWNNMDVNWVYSDNTNASRLDISFGKNTYTEEFNGYITIYNDDGTEIGELSLVVATASIPFPIPADKSLCR